MDSDNLTCSRCQYAFKNKAILVRHQEKNKCKPKPKGRVKPVEVRKMCPYCKHVFKTVANKDRHLDNKKCKMRPTDPALDKGYLGTTDPRWIDKLVPLDDHLLDDDLAEFTAKREAERNQQITSANPTNSINNFQMTRLPNATRRTLTTGNQNQNQNRAPSIPVGDPIIVRLPLPRKPPGPPKVPHVPIPPEILKSAQEDPNMALDKFPNPFKDDPNCPDMEDGLAYDEYLADQWGIPVTSLFPPRNRFYELDEANFRTRPIPMEEGVTIGHLPKDPDAPLPDFLEGALMPDQIPLGLNYEEYITYLRYLAVREMVDEYYRTKKSYCPCAECRAEFGLEPLPPEVEAQIEGKIEFLKTYAQWSYEKDLEYERKIRLLEQMLILENAEKMDMFRELRQMKEDAGEPLIPRTADAPEVSEEAAESSNVDVPLIEEPE